MKKLLALLLAMMMVLALCACGESGGSAPAAEAAPAAEEAGDDFAEYKEYIIAYTSAGAPTEDEAAAVAELVNACSNQEELEAISQLTVLFQNEIVMTYPDWVAAGKPAPQTDGMGIDPNAGSGEASGDPTGEIAE